MKCAKKIDVESAPTGEWQGDELPGWKCTNCGKHIVLDVFRWGNYCPNCGAKMTVNYNCIKKAGGKA